MREFAIGCERMECFVENNPVSSGRVLRFQRLKPSPGIYPLQSGYSLIMLIVVITIVGILAAVAMPGWKELVGIRLSSAVMKTVTDLRYAQDLAMKKGENHTVVFSATGYRVLGENGDVIEDPSYRGKKFIVDMTPDYPGITLKTSFPDKNKLSFNWKGEPSGGGRVVLSLKGEEAQVLVESGTGRISF